MKNYMISGLWRADIDTCIYCIEALQLCARAGKKKKKTCGRIVIKKKMWRSWRHTVCGFGYVVEKSMTCDIEGGKEK